MTFPAFWFFGFLNHMGWPRTTGLFTRRKIVSHCVVCGAVKGLVKGAIVLGVSRPRIAIALLADLFRKKDWSLQATTEMWSKLDPSEKVVAQPDKPPEEIIADFPMSVPVPLNSDDIKKDLIRWENVLEEAFSAHYHRVFCQGLVWGLGHSEEALDRHEKQRQRFLKKLPDMLQASQEIRHRTFCLRLTDEGMDASDPT